MIIYRNQKIFLDHDKFRAIVKKYAKIYFNDQYHTNDFIRECKTVEEEYKDDKIYAREHYEGLSREVGKVEKFVNFSNNVKSVKRMKKIMAIMAIIGLVSQYSSDSANKIATILYEVITIILLLVDATQRSEKESLY